jgi:hypothetical protein
MITRNWVKILDATNQIVMTLSIGTLLLAILSLWDEVMTGAEHATPGFAKTGNTTRQNSVAQMIAAAERALPLNAKMESGSILVIAANLAPLAQMEVVNLVTTLRAKPEPFWTQVRSAVDRIPHALYAVPPIAKMANFTTKHNAVMEAVAACHVTK